VDATVWIAAMGFGATLLTAWLGARWKRKADIDVRLIEARLRVFGACVETLAEYRRATHNRVKGRISNRSDAEREPLRQDAYTANAKARAAIGEAGILGGSPEIVDTLDDLRAKIGDLNDVDDADQLKERSADLDFQLEQALRHLREGLTAS
jgi:hypothetical protein